ncbi:hypothetical protein EZH22_26820 [Xanthobacter dioxanivorans]|uniref:Uncharacterized protein n=1 Tax=Xanthobacter dioxanivorans TaxID=2528964 RepID=A0A974PMV4_9HYPH|nr:hypothetical protein [Xanthobacter dioxanivorans]QRG06508.1 hypothetical protein EZH22_26820 [Xanthobacter dioxanivorans]
MSAVTYTTKTFASAPKAAVAPKKGFFARLMEAIVAARMEQAERELARYVQLNGRDPIA